MSQKIDIRERRFNGVDYDILHPETNINMVLDSSNNSVGDVNGALYGDGNGNIVGASISNLNLLDNSWFTVNQRGVVTTSTNEAFISDRWHIFRGTGVVNADKTITFTATQAGAAIYQISPYRSDIVGKIVTLSLLKTNGDIQSGQVVIPTSGYVSVLFDDGSLSIDTRNNNLQFTKNVVNGQTVNIKAFKLELGSVSTLANDVAPNYTTELLKCQRYFYRIKMGNANAFIAQGIVSADNISAWTLLNVPEMREIPNLTMSGAFRTVGASIGTVQAMSVATYCSGTLRVDITTTNAGTKGQPIFLVVDNDINAYIDLSADL